MSSNTKVLLILIAGVLGVAALIAGGAWYWWSRNSSDILDAGVVAITEGQNAGRGLDEGGCMAAATERHKAEGSRIAAAVRNSLWLTACLETSKVKDKFCEGVPAADNLIGTGTWAGTSCVKQGFSDPYCGTVFGVVPKYCASAHRAQKLKAGGTSKPAG